MNRKFSNIIKTVGLVCFFVLTGCSDSSIARFKPLYKDYQDIISKPGLQYMPLIGRIGALKIQLRSFLNTYSGSKKRPEAERILLELDGFQTSLQHEQFEYNELENQLKLSTTPHSTDMLIADVRNFIRKYPRTIKLNVLEAKIATLHFRKFQAQTNKPLQTITQLNKGIQMGMDYLSQIRDKNVSTKINSKIKRMEKERQRIYNSEFQLKANELLSQMKQKAIELFFHGQHGQGRVGPKTI